MLTINIIAVGKLKEKFWVDACEEYKKRLSAYAHVNITEINDIDPARVGGVDASLDKEGSGIVAACKSDDYVVLLAVEGTMLSSPELSLQMDSLALMGHSSITFIIGGSNGVSDEVRARAHDTWSFGRITHPHNIARVVLIQQIYRSFKISRGDPFHK